MFCFFFFFFFFFCTTRHLFERLREKKNNRKLISGAIQSCFKCIKYKFKLNMFVLKQNNSTCDNYSSYQ
uniref:Putative secreted protein n=1 Tax=Rhipicephalus microplus TaxID=6941 RepID=A0A6M2DEQ2_RHIMP